MAAGEALPRVSYVPVSAPRDYKSQAHDISRAIERAIRREAEVVEVSAAVVAEPIDGCLLSTACVNRVLRAGKAEAMLTAQIEPYPENTGLAGARLLISVVAPSWGISYVERRTELSPDAARVVAVGLLALARGLEPPEAMESALSVPLEQGDAPFAGADGPDFSQGDDDWLMSEVDVAPGDGGLDDELMPGEAVARDREAQKLARAARKEARAWPERTTKGGIWRGWVLELQGAGTWGATQLQAAEQISADANGVVDGTYRWAIRSNEWAYDVRVTLGRSLSRRLELGLEAGILPATWKDAIFGYYPADAPTLVVSSAAVGVHTRVGARLLWFAGLGPHVRPYFALGTGLWVIPALLAPEQASAESQPFGPYLRLVVEPAFGMRVALSRRVFLAFELRGMIDPADPVLEQNLQDIGNLSVSNVVTRPESYRSVYSGRLGLGFLW